MPFMRDYTQLLVKTCHHRNAHAIGGMAAFIPSRRDAAVNKMAFAKVREDKEREAGDGFDGTWVAHPGLVPVALEIFDRVLGDRPHQKERQRDDVQVEARQLKISLSWRKITRPEFAPTQRRPAVSPCLVAGTAPRRLIMMGDAATAEISRAQLWQWDAQRCDYRGRRSYQRALPDPR